ncbi:MAG: YlmH/Sll1252 family protein [Oscillospiraceae bacterium]|nr:YlmH/Sll1252 family protein [Oscillospiraceae bacterium]
MEQRSILLAHMDDLAAKAVKTGSAASRFLTTAEAHSITAHFAKRRDVALTFDGGYEGAERVRAVLLNPTWGEYERNDLFRALKIEVPPQEAVGHRDILGAVMALGIEREIVGDIIESPLALICLPELSAYIAENLTKAGRATIRLSEMDLYSLPVRTEELSFKTDTVASPRLDAVLGTAFGLSRGKAQELIETGRVYLNHELCQQPAKEVGEDAILSVRGMGRAKLMEIGGVSKKGRLYIKVGLYKR